MSLPVFLLNVVQKPLFGQLLPVPKMYQTVAEISKGATIFWGVALVQTLDDYGHKSRFWQASPRTQVVHYI